MNIFLKPSVLAVAALFLVGAAQATVVTFDGPTVDYSLAPSVPDFGFVYDGDAIVQNGIAVIAFDNNNVGNEPDGAGVGVLVNGADVANTCFAVQCPTGNTTHFLASVNDGVIALTAADDGQLVTLNGLQASFLGAQGDSLGSTPGLLGIQAFYGTGASDYDFAYLALSGPSGGSLKFSALSLASTALAGKAYRAINLFGFYCDPSSTSCNAFSANKGQFAIDNIDIDAVAAVPEPAQWALLAAGLAAMAGIARRRRAA